MTGELLLVAPSSAAPPPAETAPKPAPPHAPARFLPMAVGAVGVVFGDIGTSPLYAFRLGLAQVSGTGGVQPESVFGVVSLALWALILVVTLKYVTVLMRADNKGEGGTLALMALAQGAAGRRTAVVFLLGLVGASLFYGDSIITPAISVLSAVEGLKTVPGLHHTVTLGVVLSVSLAILAGLFLVQSRGTAKVARFFGPMLIVWFIVIAGIGASHLLRRPGILMAISPTFAVGFLLRHGFASLFVLGSIFLTVTGAEALYADMGHFGRWPIQAAWLFLTLPCLMLNYLGQGAFCLGVIAQAHGAPIRDLDWFFQMAPDMLRAPLVIMATVATVIASQAVITGAFSVTQQAMQLGLLPRMVVRRTSEIAAGQVYLPQVNLMLAIGVVVLVAVFKSSAQLGQAYGLAVTGTMFVDTSLGFIVMRRCWKWPLWGALAVIGPFWLLDLTFLSANLLKIFSGAALPLMLGAALFIIMGTWVRGGDLLTAHARRDSPSLDEFLRLLYRRPPHRVSGTAVYLTSDPEHAPGALLHNLKHNRVLHAHNVILTVTTSDAPRVDERERVVCDQINADFSRVSAVYGFMEQPDVPRALAACRPFGLEFDPLTTSYFLGRKTMVASLRKGFGQLQARLFILLAKNAANPTDVYQIPPGRVLEMGTQVSV